LSHAKWSHKTVNAIKLYTTHVHSINSLRRFFHRETKIRSHPCKRTNLSRRSAALKSTV